MKIFASRLITARKMKGYSIQQLAGLSDMSKQAISLYEKGDMTPSSDAIIKLARALDVDLDFFFRKPAASEILIASNIHYREKAKIDEKELDSIKLHTVEFLEKYFELERIADNRDEFINPVQELKIKSNVDAKKAAKQVRKKWKLGDFPLKNILSILESKGIKIFEVKTSEGFNGFAAWSGKIPVIVVNVNFSEKTRVRFTTLHELGHLVLQLIEGLDEEKIERICDAFASELLLPEHVLVADIGTSRSRISLDELREIKEKYGISIKAILVSLAINEIIPWETFYTWNEQYNEHYQKQDADFGEFTGTESSHRFTQLLYKCLSENKISVNKAIGFSKYSNLPKTTFDNQIFLNS
jgi:Zn-dependent peptidase ImmA (M78 family)/DNA-binding XRE family transcriptional regulator